LSKTPPLSNGIQYRCPRCGAGYGLAFIEKKGACIQCGEPFDHKRSDHTPGPVKLPARATILEYLNQDEKDRKAHKIAQETGFSVNTVRRELSQLTKDDLIQRVRRGTYRKKRSKPTHGVGDSDPFKALPRVQNLTFQGPVLFPEGFEKGQGHGDDWDFVFDCPGTPGEVFRIGIRYGTKRNQVTWTVAAPMGLTYYGYKMAIKIVDMYLDCCRGLSTPDEWNILNFELNSDYPGLKIEGANAITQTAFDGTLVKLYNKAYGVRKEVSTRLALGTSADQFASLWQGGLPAFQVTQAVFGVMGEVRRIAGSVDDHARTMDTMMRLQLQTQEALRGIQKILENQAKILENING